MIENDPNVRLPDVPSVKCPSAKCPRGKCPARSPSEIVPVRYPKKFLSDLAHIGSSRYIRFIITLVTTSHLDGNPISRSVRQTLADVNQSLQLAYSAYSMNASKLQRQNHISFSPRFYNSTLMKSTKFWDSPKGAWNQAKMFRLHWEFTLQPLSLTIAVTAM